MKDKVCDIRGPQRMISASSVGMIAKGIVLDRLSARLHTEEPHAHNLVHTNTYTNP